MQYPAVHITCTGRAQLLPLNVPSLHGQLHVGTSGCKLCSALCNAYVFFHIFNNNAIAFESKKCLISISQTSGEILI